MAQLFGNLLRALPEVAKSTPALVAYIAVVGSSTFLYARTRRNKQLLEHLSLLPEKDRRPALEAEMGTIRIPEGLTPEQWLRARGHTHLYSIGLVLVLGLIFIACLALVQSRQQPPEHVDVSFTQRTFGPSPDRFSESPVSPLPEPGSSDERPLFTNALYRYEAPALSLVDWREDPSLTQVSFETQGDPTLLKKVLLFPYRDRFRQGGPVSGLNVQAPPFRWDFPTIDTMVVNNTSDTVVVTEALLSVEQADAIKEVLVVWDDMSFTQLVMHNEGWASVENPALTVDAVPEEQCGDQPAPTPYESTVPIQPFVDILTVPIEPYLTSTLRTRPVVCVFGKLTFDDPAARRRSVRYRTRVRMQVRATAGVPISETYQVILHTGQTNTVVHRAIHEMVKPKEAGRFLLKVGSDMSGRFRFKLSLKSATGKVLREQGVELETFLPRSDFSKIAQIP